MKLKKYIFLIVSILLSGHIYSFDFITADGLGLGQTVILSHSSASVLLTVPSGGIDDSTVKIEMGINRKFEIKDLDQGYIAAAYRSNLFIFTLGFTQFGYRDFYAERTAKLGVAYLYDSLSVGATFSYMYVDFGRHYDRLNSGSFGLGASYHHKKVYGALMVENINSPRLDDNSEKIEPKFTAYTEVKGVGSYSITARMTVQNRESPQYGIGQKIYISSISALFWGLSSEPTTYGGGIELKYKKSLFTYATSYHPVLGFSHTFSLAYMFNPYR